MSIRLETADPIVRLVLEGDITIASAAELKEKLSTALGFAREISVSLAGALSLDITAIQLFWAAARQSRPAGHPFRFEPPVPPQILASLEQAGISVPSLLEGRP